ncbi:MAG: hypothetical protein KF820_06140 [Candidatus Paracaedibacteraceae bacterium]|nr:hypothetical protein [Candidatus Paracaedibacteraceae bacterium]
MSIRKSGVLKLKAQRLMVFAALGLTTAIGNVYADGGCPYSTSEFMQGMFAGNDGSFAMGNIKKSGDVTINGEKYTVNVTDLNFDANLGYLGQFGAVQALFDEVRGKARDFDNDRAVKYFAIDCVGDNVKFTVKARQTKRNPSDAKEFDFILTKTGDQHQGGQQPGDVPPPQGGDAGDQHQGGQQPGDVPPPPQGGDAGDQHQGGQQPGDAPPPPQGGDAGDQHQGGQQPGDAPPPPQGGHQQQDFVQDEVYQPRIGDVRIHNSKKERWNGSRWVRM